MQAQQMAGVFLQDLRFGLRILRRSPGFAAAAVLTLALGVGATTAVFSVANAVILRPLQFPESGRVMTVLAMAGDKAFKPMDSQYVEWRNRQQCFDIFAAALTGTRILRDGGGGREIPVAQVTAGFFRLIGLQPSIGRVFTREEDEPGHDIVALLGNNFWHREFAASPGVLGQTISLNDRQVTVIGVLPPDVHFPGFGPSDIWIPLAARTNPGGGGLGGTLVVGRLRPGTSREAAQAEMDTVTRRMRSELTRFPTRGAVVVPLREWLAGEVRGTFFMLAGAAAFLLLIACANLANLLLARGAARRREMAIRASVGAGGRRLAAQMLTESLVLAAIGGLGGMALATAIVRAAPAIRAIEIPRLEEVAVDGQFLLIGLAVSLASGFFFGLAPALQAGRRDLIAGLQGGEGPARRVTGQRFRDALVAAQLALVMVLLSGAGLMTNTLVRLLTVDLGFTRSNAFKVTPAATPKKRDRAAGAQYLRELAQHVRLMPGVEFASVTNSAPLSLVYGGYVLDYVRDGASYRVDALGRDIDPGYFRTVGIPLLAGRDFEPVDARRKPVPLILNQYAARALFGAGLPLGKLVECTDRRVGAMQVVGIVGDARVLGAAREPGPQAFAPLMGGWGFASVVVARAGVKPAALAPAIRAAVRELDPGAPPPEIAALDDIFAGQVAQPRFYMSLLTGFAMLGLTLAAIGVYGVMAYTVARRTHEFGVRLALGAQPTDIVRMVVASGARVVAAGVIAGLAGALAATRLLSSLLFEVKPRDPSTLAVTAAVLVGTALAACWFAARRAAAVDLSVALRRE
jgi:putative ABC transport system permease protein